MQLSYSRWERRDTTSREEFGRAVMRWCQAHRSANPRVAAARYYWVDAGNTITVAIEGEPGFADFDPEPDTELTRSQFALNDIARRVASELWTDARLGVEIYERAGMPSGISSACPVCDGIGQIPLTDVGGGAAQTECPSCDGTGLAAAYRSERGNATGELASGTFFECHAVGCCGSALKDLSESTAASGKKGWLPDVDSNHEPSG